MLLPALSAIDIRIVHIKITYHCLVQSLSGILIRSIVWFVSDQLMQQVNIWVTIRFIGSAVNVQCLQISLMLMYTACNT